MENKTAKTTMTKGELVVAFTDLREQMREQFRKGKAFATDLSERVSKVQEAVKADKVKNLTVKDLSALITDMAVALAEAPATPAPADSKKTAKAPKVKAQPVEASLKAAPAKTETAPAPKAGLKKPASKKADAQVEPPAEKATKAPKAPAPKVEALPQAAPTKGTQMAKMFPAEIEHKELGKLVACRGLYHTKDEVAQAIEAGKTLVFATWWTARHIKQFGYGLAYSVPCPKTFPLDLDLLQVVIVCENVDKMYAMSVITEAMFQFTDADLEETIEKDADGEYSIRVSGGMEFEIYEVQ